MKYYPALLFSLAFLIGIASYLNWYFIFFVFLIPKKHLWVISLLGIAYFKLLHPSFPTDDKGVAIFHIDEVKTHTGPFHSCLVYSGKLKAFHGESGSWHRLPCNIYQYQKQSRPLATCDYLIPQAELKKVAPYRYTLKSKESWVPLENTSSLAEWRFQLKEMMRSKMKRSYKGKNVQDLMAALITGNLTNRILSYQFSSLGLQHLLAISGFHFALITLFLAFILKRLFPEKVMAASIIFIITAYFLYMGNSPSISRAWIGVIIFLVGTLFSFRPTPLNALGVALLLQLTLNPLVVTQISFQLSFGATLGILLLYKRINQLLEPILPKRPFHVLRKLSHIDQWGYLGCAYIRNVIALNGAVLTFTLPLLLLHFKTFPLLSIVYNFFFPLLFTFLIGGLLLGLFIPGISTLNNYYANFLLTLTANAPKRLMFQLHLLDACVIALFIAICVITLQIYRKKLTKKSVISHLRKRRLL